MSSSEVPRRRAARPLALGLAGGEVAAQVVGVFSLHEGFEGGEPERAVLGERPDDRCPQGLVMLGCARAFGAVRGQGAAEPGTPFVDRLDEG